jgi:BirA family biotin operon repressor/biotin-[acetyl-CoA-carboxylase] ligase
MGRGRSPPPVSRMAVRVVFDEVESTQTEAVRRARDGAPEGTYVVAHTQRSGRGRLDRSWWSPVGGLYLSWVGKLPSAAPGLVPLSVGAELRSTLLREANVPTALKWPNDLLVPGGPLGPQKLVGILVDRVDVPEHPSKVVVGVGVNVATRRSSLPAEFSPHVAILAEISDRSPDLPEVERWVVAALERAVERLEAPSGAAAVVAECRRYLYGVGEPVHVDGRSVGILRDLAEDGAASVEHDGAMVPVHAGDLTVEEFA